MSFQKTDYPNDKTRFYDLLYRQLSALIEGIPHKTANLANASALLGQALEEINWVGFYLMEGGRLVLGPFQGLPACIEIPVGRGVCGTAVAEDKIQLVKDVHTFSGHIACDDASRSEIVIPLHKNNAVVAVLDIDSPVSARFDEADADGLARLGKLLETVF